MVLRRPRLKLQPNVVARPAAREPEATVGPPAEPAAAKPHPQLPARFKRLAPRLDVGRPGVEPARVEGATAATPGASSAETPGGSAAENGVPPVASPVTGPSAQPEPAVAAAGEAEPAAEAETVCPAPAKRPRMDSARRPEVDAELADSAEPLAGPEGVQEPPPPPPPSPPPPPRRPSAEPRPAAVGAAGRRSPSPERALPAADCRPPESPPLAAACGSPESVDPDDPLTLFSEADLCLRKRFNTPRPKNNNREILEQISERVSDNMPIRTKMMMKDLIYWNPATEAMSNSKEKPNKKGRTRLNSASSVQSSYIEAAADDPAPEPADHPPPDDEPDDLMPVPQLKIGPDGSVVVDEKSLVVKTSQQRQRDQEMSSELICDVTGSRISFNGYRQRRQINEWSIKETARFYKALSTVGTDFSIMEQLFPKRNRVDLKKKFKKEERKNPHLVERALAQDMQYDLTIFDNDVWESTVEKCKTEKQMKREAERAQRREVRARDSQVLKKERAARRGPRAVKAEQESGVAADILDSLKAPLPAAERPRRRARGRENVRPPPEPQPEPEPEPEPEPDWAAAPAGFDLSNPMGGPCRPTAATAAPAAAPPPPPPAGLPAGVVQLPPGANLQNLLIIASPSSDRPDGQVLHVYMVQPGPGQPADVNITLQHAPLDANELPEPLPEPLPGVLGSAPENVRLGQAAAGGEAAAEAAGSSGTGEEELFPVADDAGAMADGSLRASDGEALTNEDVKMAAGGSLGAGQEEMVAIAGDAADGSLGAGDGDTLVTEKNATDMASENLNAGKGGKVMDEGDGVVSCGSSGVGEGDSSVVAEGVETSAVGSLGVGEGGRVAVVGVGPATAESLRKEEGDSLASEGNAKVTAAESLGAGEGGTLAIAEGVDAAPIGSLRAGDEGPSEDL